jgi:type I restriction-modification system DNA methylase subunit
MAPSMPDPNLSSFIWSVADLLRGNYKQSEYGKVILPLGCWPRGVSGRKDDRVAMV